MSIIFFRAVPARELKTKLSMSTTTKEIRKHEINEVSIKTIKTAHHFNKRELLQNIIETIITKLVIKWM